jgi:hypothetical protein
VALHPICQIKIGEYEAGYVHEVEITSTWKELTDTCKVRMPSRGYVSEGDSYKDFRFEDVFKTGMAVSVLLGYEPDLVPIFRGYIAEIKPGVPFEFLCEDEMYLLKRKPVKAQAYSGKLSGLLRQIAPEAEVDLKDTDVQLTNFVIEKNVTVARVFQKVRDDYKLAIFFQNGKLYAGLPFVNRKIDLKPVLFGFQENVVSTDLQYKRKEDVKLKAKVISLLPDGEKIEVEAGDPDGEQRTLNYRGITDKAALRTIGERDLEKYRIEGYRGSFLAFGTPVVQHSQAVEVSDEIYPARKGRYIVEKVITTFGTGGYRQKVELGQKL